MTKEYIRKCDRCGEIIPNMYAYGVTTLFKDIRVGRGNHFQDYNKSNIRNIMEITTPDDFDGYGKGWNSDDDKELNFCSPNCVYEFFGNIYQDVYTHTVKYLKSEKLEHTKAILDDIEKRKKMSHLKKFFDRSKQKLWVDITLKELKDLRKEIKKQIKLFTTFE